MIFKFKPKFYKKMPKPTVVKPWTRQDCINSAKTQLTINNMSCGTNPSAPNAHCLQKTHTIYQKQMNQCNARR